MVIEQRRKREGERSYDIDKTIDDLHTYLAYYVLHPSKRPEYIEKFELENRYFTSLPSRVGFSLFAGIPKSQLTDLEDVSMALRDLLEQLAALEESILVDGSLSGTLNSSVSQFLLQSRHHFIPESKRRYLEAYERKRVEKLDDQIDEIRELDDDELDKRIKEAQSSEPLTTEGEGKIEIEGSGSDDKTYGSRDDSETKDL